MNKIVLFFSKVPFNFFDKHTSLTTRMHSSRMRTTLSLTIFPCSVPSGLGVFAFGGQGGLPWEGMGVCLWSQRGLPKYVLGGLTKYADPLSPKANPLPPKADPLQS